jgi:hypothetical protein
VPSNLLLHRIGARIWIATELEREELQKREVVQLSAFHGLRNRRVWHFSSTGFAHAVGSYPFFSGCRN